VWDKDDCIFIPGGENGTIGYVANNSANGQVLKYTWEYSTSGQYEIMSYSDIVPYVSSTSTNYNSGLDLGTPTAKWGVAYLNNTSHSSDRRIKKEINYDLSKYDNFFDSLRPVTYKFIDNNSNRIHTGFIAQDLEQNLFTNNLTRKDLAILDIGGSGFDVASDKVIDEDNTSYFVRYNQFHALNVYQIQKLKKRVSEQENTIKLLEDRIKALEEKIK
jgi:hypothetical protein